MPGGQEITPSDPLTGLPLAVLAANADFYLGTANGEPFFHHRNHPGNAPELGNDINGVALPLDYPDSLEGLALRHSSGQNLPDWLHQNYHEIFWGPELPRESKSKHSSVVLGLANVIPRQAIYIYEQGQYRIVDLNDSQHDAIRKRTHYEGAGKGPYYSRRGRISRYLANYALENFLPEVADEKEISLKIEEFLELKEIVGELSELVRVRDREDAEGNKALIGAKREKKSQLFNASDFIIRHALMASVEEIRPLLKSAAEAGMIQGAKRDIGQLAFKFFGSTRDRGSYIEELVQYIELATETTGQTGVDKVQLAA